jgi:type II secretory pathway pseudopilin PulG
MKVRRAKSGQEGYVLLALMLFLTLMLIAMAVEAPRIAQQIKREKEEELVHRGKDYATAVKRFVHKNGGRYPASIEQLENTNHVRFLRKKYKDPITGEDDWKMVHVGEAQINIPTPKGITGTNNPGLSGSGNPGLGGSSNTGTTSAGTNNIGGGLTGGGLSGGGQAGQGNQQSGNTGTVGSLTTQNVGTGQPIGGGAIMGVASVSKGTAIKEFNDKDHYDEWYFVYDLRLEQSGGTGVTVAAPRIGGSGAAGSTGQGQGQQQPGGTPGQTGTPQPSGTPAPSPPN